MKCPRHTAERCSAAQRRRAKRPPSFRATFARAAALTSDDGVLAFNVQPLAPGIYVERTQLHAGDACVSQAMRFDSEEAFLAWRDLDGLRFSYPLVYAKLERTCRALLARLASVA